MRSISLPLLIAEVFVTSLIALACGAAETATPVPTPTAKPAPTATLAPGAPTPTATIVPTATKVPQNVPIRGGTLKYAGDRFTSLDPNFSNTFIDRDAMFAIFDSLVILKPDLSFSPGLAKSWEVSSDGMSVTFKLQEGVKFHDGSEFTADVIKKNFAYTMDTKVNSLIRTIIGPYLADIKVVDKYTAVFQMKNPYRPLLSDLGIRDGQTLVISAAAVEKLGGGRDGKFGSQPSGAGPFKFVEWVPSDKVVVERYPDYWQKGKPYLDKVVWLDVPDYTVQLAMIRTGEADVMIKVRSDDIPLLKRNSDVTVNEFESGRFYGIFLRPDQKPFDNQKLRAAMAYAIDRKSLSDTIYGGGARPAYIPEGSGWAFNPDIKTYAYDPKKAKQMLTEAGYPNGISITYSCGGSASYIQECETIQAMLGAVGINANITLIPANDVFIQYVAGTAAMIDTYYSPRADPHGRIARVFLSTGGGNPGKRAIPGLDDKINYAATVYDIAKAKLLYDEIQTIIAEDAWVIFKVFTTEYAALSGKVQAYERYGDLNARYVDVWLKK